MSHAFPSLPGRSPANFRLAIIIGLLVPAASVSAQTCMMWVQRGNAVPVNPVGTPGQRVHHAMAYDSDRGVTVFFGGEIGKSGSETYFNDTWEYDGVRWRQMNITGPSPGERSFHAMAYDAANHQMLLYGGYHGSSKDIVPYNDGTWTYTGDGVNGTWRQLTAATRPGALFRHAMVSDPIRRKIILHGGDTDAGIQVSTYEWNGQDWTEAASLVNGSFEDFSMAFDSQQNRALVIGGNLGSTSNPIFNDRTYAYRPGVGWSNFAPWPSGLVQATMAYDPVRGRMVVVGGQNGQQGTGEQVFEFDSSHPEKGWYPGTPLPPGLGRAGAAMVYDSRRGVMVLMGGAGPGAPNNQDGGRYDDTWELVPTPMNPDIINVISSCRNSPLTMTARPGDFRSLTYQWFWDGGGLHVGNPVLSGQTNQVLNLPAAANEVEFDANGLPVPDPQWGHRTFTVVLTDACGNEFDAHMEVDVHTPPILRSARIRPDTAGTYDLETNLFRCPGDPITLTLPLGGVFLDLASPTLPARYQWLFNGQPIDTNYNPVLGGPRIIADANSLRILSLRPADTGDYSVEISNDCGTTRSSSVYLQVGVSILQQPETIEASICGTTGFEVRAIGYGPLHYQWRLDGAPLPSDDAHFDSGPGVARGQGPDLAISPSLYSHEGNYDVIVTDECGPLNAITSKVATLTLKPGPQWALRATNGPSARSAPAMAYDSHRHVTVLFGGQTASAADPNVTVSLNDLWEWDGTRWAQRMTNNPAATWFKDKNGSWQLNYAASQPPPRQKFGMVYDNRRARVVIFGGESFAPDGGQVFLNDLWEWDGTGWYFRGTNGPGKRMLHTMAYDTDRGITVLYGGFNISDNGAVWEWDGHVWATRTPARGPEKNFDQAEGAMAFDSFRHYTFFGPAVDGFFSTHFFAWDGSAWNDQGAGYTSTLTPFEYGAMAYDSYRRRSVWFGGRNNGGVTPNMTPVWDGGQWSFVANLPDAPPPSARFFNALAYDSLRHVLVMFGGEGTSLGLPPHNFAAPQTWELIAVDTPLLNDQPASQYQRPGDTAVFSVSAVGPPGAILKYQWYHGDQLITSGPAGHFNGLESSTLKIIGVSTADAGTYHARVTDDCGFTDSFAAILTLDPRLQVFSIANALKLIWSAANVVLEQADALSGPWTPVPGATPPFDIALAGPGKFFRLRQTPP